ncbi:hypothetical protein ACP8Y2_01795 [Herpetosiphon llansteffanensis]
MKFQSQKSKVRRQKSKIKIGAGASDQGLGYWLMALGYRNIIREICGIRG